MRTPFGSRRRTSPTNFHSPFSSSYSGAKVGESGVKIAAILYANVWLRIMWCLVYCIPLARTHQVPSLRQLSIGLHSWQLELLLCLGYAYAALSLKWVRAVSAIVSSIVNVNVSRFCCQVCGPLFKCQLSWKFMRLHINL